MRVLMVSKACIVGAYQTKLEELARLPGLDLHVIVPPAWKEHGNIIRLERQHVDGYHLIVSPMRLNGRFHLHYYPELPRWLRRLRPDIFHFDEEPYNLATYLGLRAGAAAGARTLFFTWQNLCRRYPWPFRAMERACFRRASYAIAGNAAAGEVLRRKGYAGPLAIIPQFGVDPSRYARGGRPAGEALRVGYAGRLVPAKGVHLLLEALAGLSHPWKALIAGSGPEEGRLRDLAERLGVAGRVEFRGQVPSAAMPAFFQEIDVLVLPSIRRPNWMEQFGRVLIEAMAAEVAVVGSDSGEIPHVIGEAGLVFPEGDALALRAGLERLAADPALRRRLAEAGRARVLSRFTQAQVARQTYEVYQAMLSSS